jgi:hypothetical protein
MRVGFWYSSATKGGGQPLRQEFLKYLVAVVDHWFFWFGGIVLVVFEIAKRISWLRSRAERLLQPNIFWGIAATCLFISTFQAWIDEDKTLQQDTQTIANLRGILQGKDAFIAELQKSLSEKEKPIVVNYTPDREIGIILERQEKELAELKSEVPSPKKRALQLSNEILAFESERIRNEPVFPPFRANETQEQLEKERNEFTRVSVQWTLETAAQYQLRFAVSVATVIEDMKAASLDTHEIEMCVTSNGNTFGIQHCGARIGALAEKLPR